MKLGKLHRIGGLLTVTSLAAATSPVAAQQIEEIVVTAQHRVQSMQDVPIAISALGTAELERRSISNILDMSDSIPNINISKNTGTSSGAKIFLRGIGEDDSRVTQDPAVGIYIDDVYLGRQTGSLLDLVDIERAEVLRGPQGTLYGRNTNGGAIRIVTKRPELESEHRVKVTLGNNDLREVSASFSGGLTDTLAGKVSLLHQTRDGFIKDTDTRDYYGDTDKFAGRVALRYMGDNWDVQWSTDFLNDDSDPGYPVKAAPFDDDGKLFTTNQSQWPLAFPAGRGDVPLTQYFNELNSYGTNLHVEGMVADDIQLTSITSYRVMENELASNMAGPYYQDVEQDQFSQEVRLAGGAEGLEWVSGVFFYHENPRQLTEYVMGWADLDLTTNSAAVFGQLTYDVTPDFRVTAGLRYTWEEKKLNAELSDDYWFGVFYGAENLGALRQKDSWSAVSWKLVGDYYLTEDSMVYLSVTNGFKSGGWSTDSLQLVDQEEVMTYELGLKSQLLDNTLRVNLAAFYNDYTDLQVNGSIAGAGFTRVNAGEVESYGVELEVTWAPVDFLDFNVYVATLDGKYKKIDGVASSIISKDYELKQSPELEYGFSINHYLALGEGELTSSLQFTHTDSYWTDIANTWWAAREETDLVNARIAYTGGIDSNYTIALWGRNLTNEKYWPSTMTGAQALYPADPRTYGIDFTYNF